MIRLGLRLSLGSGREAALRILVTAAAVALGVGLLLLTLAGINGLQAQTGRGAWLDTAARPARPTSGAATSGRLWWRLSLDQFHTETIDRVDVAAGGPRAPVPPGIPRLPGPGQFYASPALTELLGSVPTDQLGDRYLGRQVGTIGSAALPSPKSLVIVIGHTAHQLSGVPGAVEVRAIQQTPSDCYDCASGVGSGRVLQWILAGGAVALLLPVLILIATATRLSAARREERFAAMRLVGATPRQVSRIAAVEALVAALGGVAAGFGLFYLFRPLLSGVPFTGAPLAGSDLSLTLADVLLVLAGVPVAAVVSTRLALRRVQISPLGVRRRASSPAPRAVRVVPLLAGIGLLAYFDAAGKPGSNSGQILELLVGFVLLVVGLVLAGPWFTTAGSRVMAKRASSAASLIAGRRLLDNPRSAFRFISGLVLALFIASAATGALSSIEAVSSSVGGSAAKNTLAELFCGSPDSLCPASALVPSVPGRLLTDLHATPGVRAVTLIHTGRTAPAQGASSWIVACGQLAGTPAIGRCPPGATAARVGAILQTILGANSHASSTVWPAAHISPAALGRLPVSGIVVATNGSPASMERARTALERAYPLRATPVVVEALGPSVSRLLAMVRDLTDVVIVASLIVAACSLAVNIAAGLSERKRSFSLLRLTGVPTAVLRRIVALESALPLLLVAAVSVLIGLVSAALYLHSQVGIAFRLPGFAYWATVLGGVACSLAIIASTFPLLDRITGPEHARNE